MNKFKMICLSVAIFFVAFVLYSISKVLLIYAVLLAIVGTVMHFILKLVEEKLLAYRNNNKRGFYFFGILGYLLACFILSLKFNFVDVFIFITFITLMISIKTELMLKERNRRIEEEREKEFLLQYPEVAEKYKGALAILEKKGKNFESYEYITVNILGKAKELYFSRKKIIEDKKSIAATRIELEDVINEAETKNDKISMLQKRLEKIQRREIIYNKYIEDTQEAIKSTIYDFVGIKADIELANSNGTKQIKLDNKALEEKSKLLSDLQKQLPLFDDIDDDTEVIDVN